MSELPGSLGQGSKSITNNDTDLEKTADSKETPKPLTETPKAVSNWRKPPAFYLSYLAILLMVFIVSIDATALSVAIPILSNELGGTTLEAFWANIIFMLAVTVAQPIYTSTSNVLGRKPPLYFAFALFALGSIVFAIAQSMGTVIAGRVLQGLGCGGLDVLSEILVADITTLKDRALWIGLLSFPLATGCILGPILGALFSEYVDWRWIGWINLPILAVAFALAFFFMHLKPMEGTLMSQLARLDWLGFLLFSIGSILFSLPLSWAGAMYPWGSWRTILPLVIGVIALVIFVIYERRPEEPVFPHRIFRSRTAQVTLLGSFIHGMVLYALLLYLPLFFQSVLLETPLQSAISILPFCCVVMAFSGIAALGVEYLRSYRWEIWSGWVLLAVGVGLFALWDETTSLGESVGFQFIAGVGIGTLFSVPPMPMQASVPTEDQGLAVGILVAFRLFGALIGLAIGATAFSEVFNRSMDQFGPLPAAAAILENSNQAVSFIPTLRQIQLAPNVMQAITEAYRRGLQSIWYVLCAFGALGFVASLFTEDLAIESEELGRQHLEHSD